MGFLINFSVRKKKRAWTRGCRKPRKDSCRKISRAVAGKTVVDEEVLDSLEEALVGASDVGIDTTLEIIRNVEQRVALDKYLNTG